jgi:hypothetical protein
MQLKVDSHEMVHFLHVKREWCQMVVFLYVKGNTNSPLTLIPSHFYFTWASPADYTSTSSNNTQYPWIPEIVVIFA